MGKTMTAQEVTDFQIAECRKVLARAKARLKANGHNVGEAEVLSTSRGRWMLTLESDAGGVALTIADEINASSPMEVLVKADVAGEYIWKENYFRRPFGKVEVKF